MRNIITCWCLGIFLFSAFISPFSLAQDITLTYGMPAEVNMNDEILNAGVSLFRKAVEEDKIRNVVLLVARNGKTWMVSMAMAGAFLKMAVLHIPALMERLLS